MIVIVALPERLAELVVVALGEAADARFNAARALGREAAYVDDRVTRARLWSREMEVERAAEDLRDAAAFVCEAAGVVT